MSDPLDLAHLVTGAVAAAAPTLPPALGTLARILHAGVSLALTARAAGLDPEQEIARMERALGRFDARADAARAALDAADIAPDSAAGRYALASAPDAAYLVRRFGWEKRPVDREFAAVDLVLMAARETRRGVRTVRG